MFKIFRRSCLKLVVGDESVERIVMAHGWNKRPGKVYAFFPVHAFLTAGRGNIGKPGMGDFCKLHRPRIVGRISGDLADTIERVHPFRQIMIILSISIETLPRV